MLENSRWRKLVGTGILLLVSTVGCGKSPPPMNNNVQGTVKVNGVALAGVVVQFVPDAESGLLSANAITDAQGHFEMQTGDQPGAILGKHKVIVTAGRGNTSRANDPQAAQPDDNNVAPAAAKNNPKIPPGASDLLKTTITVEITADKHTDYDLDLGKGR